MAGIGFELRKIFGKKTLVSNVFGVMYASMASVGPSLVFIFLLFTVRLILQYFSATELEKIYFTASFTYAFLIAMLISAFLTSIISRYVSDRIFQGIEADIASSLYGVMILGTVVSGLVAGVLCVFMYRYDHVPLLFCVAYYLLTILATNVYNLISFVSALKEYKKITLSYLCGVILAIILFFVLYKAMDVSIILAIYLSLVGGFILILFALLCMCIKFFGMPNDNLFGFVTYFKKYPKLFLSGILYTLGFYVSNIVYWFTTDMSIQAGIFRISPNYDMALFLGILVNLSGLIIFEVKTETSFYEKNIEYLSALNKGTYDLIETKREELQNNINLQLFFVYEVQLIITIILLCLANICYPYLGINSQVLNMMLLLGMGVYCSFCMYFTVIILYYFEDYTSALLSTAAFFAIVLIGSLICCVIGSPTYPIPIISGGIVGWVISFLRLRKRLEKLNSYLLCR